MRDFRATFAFAPTMLARTHDIVQPLLCWLSVVPTVVFLCLEMQVHRVIWGRLRVYNAVDLFVVTIFYHHIFEVRGKSTRAFLWAGEHAWGSPNR